MNSSLLNQLYDLIRYYHLILDNEHINYKQYEENLISKGILSKEKAKDIKISYRKSLEGGKTVAKNLLN